MSIYRYFNIPCRPFSDVDEPGVDMSLDDSRVDMSLDAKVGVDGAC